MISVAPFIVFLVGAVLATFARGRLRDIIVIATPVVGAINLCALDGSAPIVVSLFGRELILVQVDRLSMLFCWLFHLATFLALIYGLHRPNKLEQVVSLAYAASTMGAIFAGDLLTLLMFWEGLGLTSVFLILARRTSSAEKAAFTQPRQDSRDLHSRYLRLVTFG